MNTFDTKYGEVVRINNDINGNPRFVIHFTSLNISMQDYWKSTPKTRKARIKKYHNKNYWGGYSFKSYEWRLNHDLDYIYNTLHWKTKEDIKSVEDLPLDTSKISFPEYPSFNCTWLYRATIFAYLQRWYINDSEKLKFILIKD